VLSIHAHGGDTIFPVGKAYHCRPDPDDPNQYSFRAAQAGFRVLAPDAFCFGERQTTWGHTRTFHDEVLWHHELCARNRSLAWKSVWDNSRAIEALESLGASRVGSIGHSGGSTQCYILAAANPNVQAAVCFASFATLRHQYYRHRLAHCCYHFIPGMLSAGIDWDQVVALAAPRKLFMGWGGKDEGTPAPMAEAFVDAIRDRCRREGLPDSVVAHHEPQADHAITEPMLSAALEFLKAELG
jgi:dienelactone hydrolase